uniref:Uncharacterized protein n=1 Tax=Arundo donax TaxID=35708 RepID=A0A0A8ZJM7_ARUDO
MLSPVATSPNSASGVANGPDCSGYVSRKCESRWIIGPSKRSISTRPPTPARYNFMDATHSNNDKL